MKLLIVTVVVLSLIGCKGGGGAKVEVTSVRVVPFTNDAGKTFPMVLVDWKNVGSTPVTVVYATITAQDASGNDLDYQAEDYCIFVASGKDAQIAPGETYHAPEGEGHILLPSDGTAANARVEVTRVSDEPQS